MPPAGPSIEAGESWCSGANGNSERGGTL